MTNYAATGSAKYRFSPHRAVAPQSEERRKLGRAAASMILLTTLLSLSACADIPTDPTARAEYNRTNDPAEPTNRVIFAGNQFVDRNLLRPIARGYEDYVPDGLRNSLHNFVDNLGQPAILVNDVLQANFSRALNTTERFAINTTVGGVGFFDVATDWNKPAHSADFGQTLGVWDVGPGPAVQLPIFGPSNVRDSVGKVVSLVTNPINFVPGAVASDVTTASGGLGIVDKRAELLPLTDDLERNSVDYYAALRSASAQHRAKLVGDGKAGLVSSSPNKPASLSSTAPQTSLSAGGE